MKRRAFLLRICKMSYYKRWQNYAVIFTVVGITACASVLFPKPKDLNYVMQNNERVLPPKGYLDAIIEGRLKPLNCVKRRHNKCDKPPMSLVYRVITLMEWRLSYTPTADVKEHWACDYAADGRLYGDCEDFAMCMRERFAQAGINPSYVHFAVTDVKGTPHVVLIVLTADEGYKVVDSIMGYSDLPQHDFKKIEVGFNKWVKYK